jgi:thioredoxin 1
MSIKTVVYPYELEDEIKNNKNLFAMFSASWCGPCKIIKPAFIQYSEDSKYNCIQFLYIDIDDADEICQEYKIRSVPTFIMFVDSVVYDRIEGIDQTKIQKILDDQL